MEVNNPFMSNMNDYIASLTIAVYESYKHRWCGSCWKFIPFGIGGDECYGCRIKCRNNVHVNDAPMMYICWKAQLYIPSHKIAAFHRLGIPPTKEAAQIITLCLVKGINYEGDIHRIYNTYKRYSISIEKFIDAVRNERRSIYDPLVQFYLEVLSKQTTQRNIQEMWEMDTHEFENGVQWLPREMVEDTLELLFK